MNIDQEDAHLLKRALAEAENFFNHHDAAMACLRGTKPVQQSPLGQLVKEAHQAISVALLGQDDD